MINWMKMSKATFSFFLTLTLTSLVSFCWSVLLPPGLMKGNYFCFSLTCVVYLAYLLRKSLGFLIPFLLAHHMSYLQLYLFFCPASSVELTTGEITFGSCWSACRDSASFKRFSIIYCIEYISLDSISCSLPIVRTQPFRFTKSSMEHSVSDRRRFYEIKLSVLMHAYSI